VKKKSNLFYFKKWVFDDFRDFFKNQNRASAVETMPRANFCADKRLAMV
jgi:hypothetical protein